MTRSIDPRSDHAKIARDILAQHMPVGVFGSRAKGAAKPSSDLDLALKSEDRLSRGVLADLAEALSESDLPFRVDVLDWRSVAPSFREAIDRGGIEFG